MATRSRLVAMSCVPRRPGRRHRSSHRSTPLPSQATPWGSLVGGQVRIRSLHRRQPQWSPTRRRRPHVKLRRSTTRSRSSWRLRPRQRRRRPFKPRRRTRLHLRRPRRNRHHRWGWISTLRLQPAWTIYSDWARRTQHPIHSRARHFQLIVHRLPPAATRPIPWRYLALHPQPAPRRHRFATTRRCWPRISRRRNQSSPQQPLLQQRKRKRPHQPRPQATPRHRRASLCPGPNHRSRRLRRRRQTPMNGSFPAPPLRRGCRYA